MNNLEAKVSSGIVDTLRERVDVLTFDSEVYEEVPFGPQIARIEQFDPLLAQFITNAVFPSRQKTYSTQLIEPDQSFLVIQTEGIVQTRIFGKSHHFDNQYLLMCYTHPTSTQHTWFWVGITSLDYSQHPLELATVSVRDLPGGISIRDKRFLTHGQLPRYTPDGSLTQESKPVEEMRRILVDDLRAIYNIPRFQKKI